MRILEGILDIIEYSLVVVFFVCEDFVFFGVVDIWIFVLGLEVCYLC